MNWSKFLSKISSRKFWALLAGLIGSVLVVANVDENQIAQVTAIVTGFGTIAVYIFAEASVDRANVEANKQVESEEE
jgi:hypothetical protein